MLIAVASLNSPGVTTVAVGLAAHWPADHGQARPVVVELDPEGGDVAARWRARSEPGLADVAAAVASTVGAGSEVLAVGLQSIEAAGSAVTVVCAPPGGRVVRQALPLLTAPGSKVLNPPDGVVVADLGSLYDASPAWSVAVSADAVILVVEGTLGCLAHLRSRLDEAEELARLGPRVAVVVVAEADYTAADVNGVFLAAGLPVRLLGRSGTPESLITEAGGRRDRRAQRVWGGLAAAVAEFAAAPGQLVLTSAPVPDPSERAEAFEKAADEAIHQTNRDLLASGRAPIAEAAQARLRQSTTARLAGLGGLAVLLADASIEDIVCNGCDNVWVVRSDGTREQVAPVAETDADLVTAVQVLAAGAGMSDTERRFDRAAPALNLRLPDGSRLHAIRDVAHRPSVSIRRHRLAEAELGQLERGGMFSAEIAALLRAAVQADFNMILAGPMGSGKTTLLRALAGLLPVDERIVTIEDNYELGLHTDARHGNVVALQVREPNIEGAGGISAWELFYESLRMRPDRVIVGEARGPEIAVMLDAMSNGADGSLSTIHTSTSAGVFTKMKTYARRPPAGYEPEATAELIGGSLDLVVQLAQVRGRRWVASIREVCGSEGAMVVSNELYAPIGPDRTAQQATPVSAARAERLAEYGWAPPNMQGRW